MTPWTDEILTNGRRITSRWFSQSAGQRRIVRFMAEMIVFDFINQRIYIEGADGEKHDAPAVIELHEQPIPAAR